MVRQQTKRNEVSSPFDGEESISLGRRVWEEAVDHVLPWGPAFLAQRAAMQAAGIGLAVVVTVAWLLAAAGRVSSVAVIAWWVGWSVYELLCRRRCKPWVKEGPWWGRKRRPASTVDLLFYVATKNLLIGAGLFLVLALLGVIQH
jgi:NosR/NirI family nitrous oxide reductase transcriptional regulator